MSRPHILILENSVDVTGALTSILRSSMMLEKSFNFSFILPKNSRAIPYVQNLGFPVYTLPMKEMKKDWITLILYIPLLLINTFRFVRIVEKLKINIVLCNDFYNLIPPMYALFGWKVPYVCYVRFRPSKFPSVLVTLWSWFHHRFAAGIVAVSDIVKNELPFQARVVVIGNELPFRAVAYMPALSKTILYPSNYIQGKGHEYALESFAIAHQKHPQWKLKFLGGDMGLKKNQLFKLELQQKAIRLGISTKIEWADFVSDMEGEYLAAAFILNFSQSESFSMTCLESGYYGRPVIATKSGGPSEIIEQYQTGILVEVDEIKGMALAIEYLITHPEEREVMAKNAYQSVRVKFSFQNTVGKLKSVYDSALSKQSFNTR